MKSAQAMSERGERAWVLIVDRGEWESPCMDIQGGVCVCVKESLADEKFREIIQNTTLNFGNIKNAI
jgi:hypothetical protein